MRPRAVGGFEPDDRDQRELVELWHLSRIVRSARDRSGRLDWVVTEFCLEHPGCGRKWVYVWSEANLGRLGGRI
jgi:hypothetical protein